MSTMGLLMASVMMCGAGEYDVVRACSLRSIWAVIRKLKEEATLREIHKRLFLYFDVASYLWNSSRNHRAFDVIFYGSWP